MKISFLFATLIVVDGIADFASAFVIPPSSKRLTSKNHQNGCTLQMNFFSDIGDMLTGGKIGEETNLPYSPPLCGIHSINGDEDENGEKKIRSYAIKERGISFTGEDFDIFDITDNKEEPYARVRGAMLHLPGKDKMRIRSVADGHDEEVCVLDRVFAVTPTYDIYR